MKRNGDNVTGCCLLPDGRRIFHCFKNKEIYLLKIDKTFNFELQTGMPTSHILFIEESQNLVVSTGHLKSYFTIIDMKNGNSKKSLKVGSDVYGIAHKDGKL